MVSKKPIIGVDFGQAQDFTAIAYGLYGGEVEFPAVDPNGPSKLEPILNLKYLRRLQLGMSYEDQVRKLRALYDQVHGETGQRPLLIVDGTGVGRAITEMVRKAGMPCIMVTVTGGSKPNKEGSNWTIPKKDLVGPAQLGIQNRTIKLAKGLAHAEILVKELQNFHHKQNIATGNDTFEAHRESDHDDLVFAVSLVAYAFRTSTEPGVCARTIIPSKYNDGTSSRNKYR